MTTHTSPNQPTGPYIKRSHVSQIAEHDSKRVCRPDTNSPFTSIDDAVERLLPYHIVASDEGNELDHREAEALGSSLAAARWDVWQGYATKKANDIERRRWQLLERIDAAEKKAIEKSETIRLALHSYAAAEAQRDFEAEKRNIAARLAAEQAAEKKRKEEEKRRKEKEKEEAKLRAEKLVEEEQAARLAAQEALAAQAALVGGSGGGGNEETSIKNEGLLVTTEDVGAAAAVQQEQQEMMMMDVQHTMAVPSSVPIDTQQHHAGAAAPTTTTATGGKPPPTTTTTAPVKKQLEGKSYVMALGAKFKKKK